MKRSFESLMLRTLLGPIVAVLQLFALYVVMHGHYSPGGGFQAGVLLACALILPMLVHGRQARQHGFPTLTQEQAVALAAVGVLIYAAIGVLSMRAGHAMLDYDDLPLPGLSAARRSLGILGIEVGVTLAVAGAVVAIFRALQDQEGEVETSP
jgi:multicomponent Na+:H+ antiporter subunit B